MIRAVGIDIVCVQRFSQWHTYSPTFLSKLFSDSEIAYCCSAPGLSAQRFAVRFAAKEAFYKALCAAYGSLPFSLRALCTYVEVRHTGHQVPFLYINWQALGLASDSKTMHVHCSLSHSSCCATVVVVLQEKS